MRGHHLLLPALAFSLVACAPSRQIERSALDLQYEETALAEDTLSSVPLRIEPDADGEYPRVVSWSYAGSRRGMHYLVFRSLTWDREGDPVGNQRRYRLKESELTIQSPIDYTRDSRRWLPLYEASPEFDPPADVVTRKQLHDPIQPRPIEPTEVEPEDIAPQDVSPLDVSPQGQP